MGKLFLFVIYSFLFLCVGGSVIGCFFGFSPFAFFSFEAKEIYLNPFSDWYVLYKRFWYDNWVVNSAHDLMLFFTFLFFFPVYIALWFWVRKVKWLKGRFKLFAFRKNVKVVGNSSDVPVKKRYDRPMALRQSKSFSLNVLQEASQEKTQAVSESHESSDLSSSEVTTQFSTGNQIPSELKDQIRELGAQYGYDMFENVLLKDVNVPLVLATDTVALLLNPLIDKKEWIADETSVEDGSEPTWFSAEGLITSPFYSMSIAAEQLKMQEPESDIVPVVLLCDGSILNAGALAAKWQEKNGFVALLNEGKADGLPSFTDLLTMKNPQNPS